MDKNETGKSIVRLIENSVAMLMDNIDDGTKNIRYPAICRKTANMYAGIGYKTALYDVLSLIGKTIDNIGEDRST